MGSMRELFDRSKARGDGFVVSEIWIRGWQEKKTERQRYSNYMLAMRRMMGAIARLVQYADKAFAWAAENTDIVERTNEAMDQMMDDPSKQMTREELEARLRLADEGVTNPTQDEWRERYIGVRNGRKTYVGGLTITHRFIIDAVRSALGDERAGLVEREIRMAIYARMQGL